MFKQKFFTVVVTMLVFTFLAINFEAAFSLKEVLEENQKNNARNIAANIHNSINKKITPAISMSQMMANTTFVKEWLQRDAAGTADPQEIVNYLHRLGATVDLDTVFVVSAATNNYYSEYGYSRKISHNVDHDIWYYFFLDSLKQYDLNIDTDPVHNNSWTVFVNHRVEDNDGKLLGVCGLGVQLGDLQDILRIMEKENSVKINLVNEAGVVQVDTNNIYVSTPYLSDLNSEAKSDYAYMAKNDGYVVTRWLQNLDWFLVVSSDKSPAKALLRDMVKKQGFIILLIIVVFFWGFTYYYRKDKHESFVMETTDELTQARNRRYVTYLKKRRLLKSFTSVALVDIDNFKTLNDTKGHAYGDEVLRNVSALIRRIAGKDSELIRWGGDELLLLFKVNEVQAAEYCDLVLRELRQYNVTLSVGIAPLPEADLYEEAMQKADVALYEVKHNGKNGIAICDFDGNVCKKS